MDRSEYQWITACTRRVRNDLPTDWNANCSLPGVIVISIVAGCFRAVAVDFDRRWPISGGINRGRKKKREKKRENVESAQLSRSICPHGEKKRLPS
ncbi:hypothetical protein B296_00054803 [Ensete ventricosum]|uniref:Uncharacterized protein n=1 Tax=Ensete ventricosum TaxID=4639 RepID=A0A426XU86_ENSVE|nr:hypothetical protein B296_00054803 [Ensete ventricosum]